MEEMYWFLLIFGILATILISFIILLYGHSKQKLRQKKITKIQGNINKVNGQLDQAGELLDALASPVQQVHTIFDTINKNMDEKNY